MCEKVFTFVPSWNSDVIDPNTYRLYGKKLPAQEATKLYIEQTRNFLRETEMRERKADDVQNPRYSHCEWQPATEQKIKKLNSKVKEPDTLLFFRGAIYECTYNQDEKFSTSQLCMVIDLPSQEDIDNFRKIELLVAPPGLQDLEFNADKTKEEYIPKPDRTIQYG